MLRGHSVPSAAASRASNSPETLEQHGEATNFSASPRACRNMALTIVLALIIATWTVYYSVSVTNSKVLFDVPYNRERASDTSLSSDVEHEFLRSLGESYPELLPSTQFLPQITEFELRRSRVHLGDLRKFHKVLKKLDGGICLNILVLGGSISLGTMIDPSKGEIWYQQLLGWLNHAFPCDETRGHNVTNKAEGGKGSNFFLTNFHRIVTADATVYDVIFLELTANDGIADTESVASHHIPNQNDDVAYSFELLVRTLLDLPYNPLVIDLELGWRFGKAAEAKNEAPFYQNAVLGHEPMLQYYQIPTVSTFHNLHPLHLYNHIAGHSNPNDTNKIATWFADDFCHPNADGHKWAAVTVAYAFYIEHFKMSNDPSEVLRFEFDSKGQLPPIWMTSPKDQERFAELTMKPLTDYNFESADWDAQWDSGIRCGTDWKLRADKSGKSGRLKWGLIATQQNSEMAVAVNVERFIVLQYLRTYEHIGSVNVWIDETDEINENKKQCARLDKVRVPEVNTRSVAMDGSEYFVMNGMSEQRVSVAQQAVVAVRGGGGMRWVHLCLPTKDRFKLLGLTAF